VTDPKLNGPAVIEVGKDVVNEQLLIAAACVDPAALATLVEKLQPHHFHQENRSAWEAVVDIHRRGLSFDPVLVGQLGGEKLQKYVESILDARPDPPTPENLAHYVATAIWDRQRYRSVAPLNDFIEALKRGESPEKVRAHVKHMAEALDAGPGGEGAPGFAFTFGRELAEAMPPIEFLLPHFGIGPGRPNLLAGYGGIGKTLIAQSIATSLAARLPVCFGALTLPPASGSVRHIDYEMTYKPTKARYQRFAYGLGVDLAVVAERIGVSSMPRLYLSDAGAEDALLRASDGAALVIIDSLAAACSTDGRSENDAAVRRNLDKLTRVSDRTGATFLVLVHENKQQHGDDRPALQRVRGSGAITDAAGSVVSVTAHGGMLTLRQTKRWHGSHGEPVHVRFVDVGDPEEAAHARGEKRGDEDDLERWLRRGREPAPELPGMLVVTCAPAEAAQMSDAAIEKAKARLTEVLKQAGSLGVKELLRKAGGNGAVAKQALAEMRESGRVVEVGKGARGAKFLALGGDESGAAR
jgi:hypothetical protein